MIHAILSAARENFFTLLSIFSGIPYLQSKFLMIRFKFFTSGVSYQLINKKSVKAPIKFIEEFFTSEWWRLVRQEIRDVYARLDDLTTFFKKKLYIEYMPCKRAKRSFLLLSQKKNKKKEFVHVEKA